MTRRADGERAHGFALVLTLALLALLVLAVFALSVLVRTSAQVADGGARQVQARQNAQLALAVAVGALQETAGPDNRVTGTAGMSGVLPQSPVRQWCGVWAPGTAAPIKWLVSGAAGTSPSIAGDAIQLVGSKTVGSPTDRTDQELVQVGEIEIPGTDLDGAVFPSGHVAYWVGDEGAKISAIVPEADLQRSGQSGSGLRANLKRLISSSFSPDSTANRKVLSLEQLKLAASSVSLTGSFHSLTVTSRALPATAGAAAARSDGYVWGAFNVNTTSEAAWRAWLEFPDQDAAVFGLAGSRPLNGARRIRDLWTARGVPFSSVDEVLASGLVARAFATSSPKITSITERQFVDELRPILTVRSDTFRIRAYGDVINPVTGVREATAYCEAIVQRTPDLINAVLGRRFVITYFRWLGPNDI